MVLPHLRPKVCRSPIRTLTYLRSSLSYHIGTATESARLLLFVWTLILNQHSHHPAGEECRFKHITDVAVLLSTPAVDQPFCRFKFCSACSITDEGGSNTDKHPSINSSDFSLLVEALKDQSEVR